MVKGYQALGFDYRTSCSLSPDDGAYFEVVRPSDEVIE